MTVHVSDDIARALTRSCGPDWVADLPRKADERSRAWNLTPTGAPLHGAVSLVVPVTTADGRPAVLKIQPVDDETRGEPDALRLWDGRGAARLLDHDPATGTLLLEALDHTRDLDSTIDAHGVDQALEIIAGLLTTLNTHHGPPHMRHLGAMTRNLVARTRRLTATPLPHGLADALTRWADIAADIAPDAGDRLLHWDLHYQNVLAPLPGTGRGPWLAIDPKPLVGDPGYELLPALWNRFPHGPETERLLRRRFDLLTDATGIDRDRARAWTLVRVLENTVWPLEEGDPTGHGQMLTLARALGA
ncbi:aminoglycoside phosphotransferase family protein [Nocardiopsis sp. N85]|uniref:aminoglycoside phosphotransferase family protein n=1 Tax=Nocardiopsis sp. N85 TaxID=3029400 RepID=UPI00237F16E9|nr:aminoglycoside phosphotransferase family protein [Nocardiopsis sp. N85]MDE3722243.1 aminoglycoside phosphotransferase family protein [Nocardiopsis sp. N85]